MEETSQNGVALLTESDEESLALQEEDTGPPPVARLCALDQLFAATGVAHVKVGHKTLAVPIQSIDNEVVEAFVKPYRAVPPTRAELQNGRRVIVENQADKAYLEKLAEYNRTWLYAVAFHGMAVDIVDTGNRIVWSADNTVRDLPLARVVIKQMGLVDNQLGAIVVAINRLTQFAEETQAGN